MKILGRFIVVLARNLFFGVVLFVVARAVLLLPTTCRRIIASMISAYFVVGIQYCMMCIVLVVYLVVHFASTSTVLSAAEVFDAQ